MRPPAEAIGALALVVGGIALVIFIGVETALLYAAWRYRASRNDGPAPQIHGNSALEITWTAIPIVILAVVLVLMLGTMREISATQPSSGPAAMRIAARGYQWWWEFRYPGSGGDVVTANELHIPTGTAIDLELTSADVVHSFWVPSIAGKTDLIPGKTNVLRLFAGTPGTYPGQCAEFCGVEHAWMRITVVAQTNADFQSWLAAQAAPVAAHGAGEDLFVTNVCASCHTIRGTSAKGAAGPDLTHVASRRTIGAGVLPNDLASMRAWLGDPQKFKQGSFMPGVPLSSAELDALASYLESLK